MVAPSGDQFAIAGGGYQAVVTECGAGLRVLEHDGRPLILGYDEEAQATSGRGQLLLPWPNRIKDGRYSFAGADHQLPITEVARGHASHGLTRWEAWTVRAHTSDAVTLGYRLMSRPGYPWALDLTASYALSDDGLAVTVTGTNVSSSPAPFASGAHPYLAPGGRLDGWELTVPAATAVEVDDRLIPAGTVAVDGTPLDFRRPRRIDDLHLDTAYGDLSRDAAGWAEVRLRGEDAELVVRMDQHHRWVQLFTGPPGRRDALAVEPMTAPPNAFATGQDLIVLAPEESVTVRWALRLVRSYLRYSATTG